MLHTAASRVGALDLGFVPGEGGLDARQMAAAGALDVVFLLGADEIEIAPGAFVVYIGTHGDRGAHRADVILPGAAYPEKSGIYVNTEGRVQMADARLLPARRCARGLGDPARAVGRARAAAALRFARRSSAQALYQAHPHLLRIDEIAPGDAADHATSSRRWAASPTSAPFRASDQRFLSHQSDRARSAVMAECSALAEGRAAATAAE